MRAVYVRTIAGAAAVLMLAAVAPGSAAIPTEPSGAETAETDAGTGLWTIRLADPPLATYTGGTPGLRPTSPRATGESRLDVAAPASVAYLDHLEEQQDRLTLAMERRLDRRVEVVHEYRNVVNGIAVRVSDEEAEALAELPGVETVYRDVAHELDTDASHDLIGSAAAWGGETGTGLPSRGEGVVVGMLDTGVNPDHPSFAATDGEGYSHTNPLGDGNYVGVCAPEHPRHEDICNDKLIGAWSFHPFSGTARDFFDHGSHVGSTIAGNVHEATFTVGGRDVTRMVQGVAPRANVISYQVCFPTCPETSTVAAVDQAIADPTQVLNYSIEGVDNPWGDLVSLAFLDAFNAGIFVTASAGNSGPQAGTAAKTAPWNASVAAANHHRVFGHPVEVTEPVTIDGIAGVPGTGPVLAEDATAEIRDGGLGCTVYPDGALDGAIALVDRGECPYAVKIGNAAAAGAVAVVVAADVPGPPTTMAQLGFTTIPAVMVDRAAGAALRGAIDEHAPEPVIVRISADVQMFVDEAWGDTVAEFSSRGPSRFELLAPTLAAPGVGVLAAASPVGDDPDQYLVASGTSMAAPHVAGAGALLLSLHPDWSPAQVRSALAGTAAELAGDMFDAGAGLLDVAGAARVGLVLDESYVNFVAANPASGGDPKQLNLPAFVDHGCAASCSWIRTVTHVGEGPATYTAMADTPAGTAVTAAPAEFSLEPGASQTVRITLDLDPDVHPAGDRAFASVGFVTDAVHPSGKPIAPVRYPIAVIAAEPDDISLTAEAYRSRATVYAELTWAGATSDQVDILRDGELLATVPAANRRYVDDLGRLRDATIGYQVCRVGSREVCSAEATAHVDQRTGPRPTPMITTAELPGLHLLERYEQTLLATGGSGSYRWEASGLPSGLVLDESTGVLRNDPDNPAVTETDGPIEVTVSVRDATRRGPADTATFRLDVVGVDQVATGWGHTCAVTSDAQAYCWGRDATGQIGRGVVGGDGIHVPLPEPVLNADGDGPLTGVVQIAGGDGHTCALTTEGTVYCWGAAFDGRLGDGDPQSQPKPLPVQVRAPDGDGPLTDVVQIAVGWQFGCAVTTAEELYCWGNNSSGKLGIGTVGGTEPLPVGVRNSAGTAPLTGVSTVAAGSSHACAVAGGTPYCWGGNFQGQLGIGETSAGEPLPVPVTGSLDGVTQLAAGSSHACARIGDGAAYCWGSNGSGQLGTGEAGSVQPAPVRVQGPNGAEPLSGVADITVDGNHTCALTAAANAYCWGAAFDGQLGTGDFDGRSLPSTVQAGDGTGALSGVTSLTAGSSHTCALTTTGAVHCWGANFNWQLGIGETDQQHREPLPVPVRPGPSR